MPWGGGGTWISGLHDHIGSWEHLFRFLSYCTSYAISWTLLHLFTHVLLFWSGYVVYHLLGRVGIRLCISFILLVWVLFGVWQPGMWVCSPRHSLSMSMLFYVQWCKFVELRMDMGGMFWMRSYKVGGWLWVVLEIHSMWLRCSILRILICLSLVWLFSQVWDAVGPR